MRSKLKRNGFRLSWTKKRPARMGSKLRRKRFRLSWQKKGPARMASKLTGIRFRLSWKKKGQDRMALKPTGNRFRLNWRQIGPVSIASKPTRHRFGLILKLVGPATIAWKPAIHRVWLIFKNVGPVTMAWKPAIHRVGMSSKNKRPHTMTPRKPTKQSFSLNCNLKGQERLTSKLNIFRLRLRWKKKTKCQPMVSSYHRLSLNWQQKRPRTMPTKLNWQKHMPCTKTWKPGVTSRWCNCMKKGSDRLTSQPTGTGYKLNWTEWPRCLLNEARLATERRRLTGI